jgi:DNA-binding LacI/PurR family transcriptional regulator
MQVPEDISITGFDGFAISEWSTPQLTTVSQPLSRIGSKAAELLVQTLAQEDHSQRRIVHAVLPGRLLARASLGPAPR